MQHARRSLVIALALGLAQAPTLAQDITWDVHIGLWQTAANWSPSVVPGSGDNVFITNPGRIEQVTIDTVASANAVTLSDGGLTRIPDSITLLNGIDFSFAGGGFLNDGHFFQSSSGADTFVQFLGSQVIAGRGEWVLSDNAANRIIGNGGQIQHGNGFGHELRGAGQLLANSASLWNRSTIRQQGNEALIIDPNANGVDNDGLLVAEGSGGLTLQGGSFDNSDGTIRAGAGSVVRLSASTFTGGTLDTIGDGVLLPDALPVFQGIFLNGTLRQDNGQDAQISGGLTNNGTWTLASAGADTFMQFIGSQSITGNGQIVLSDSPSNRIISNGATITVGAQQTIRGAGQLGANSAAFINQGTLLAQGTTPLVIDPNANGFVQTGVLRAEGSGGLELTDGTFTLTNPVELTAGSALLVQNSIIAGGVIQVAPGETADLRFNTLQGVTLEGAAIQTNGIHNTFTGGLTLNGTWTLASAGSDTFMQFTGSQSITGSGQIVLSDSPSNRIISNGATLTLGADQTIRGAGQLGANSAAFVNQGTLLAQGTTPLVIDPNANGFVQTGVLRAEGSGGLRLISGTFTLTNPVELTAGSALLIDSAVIAGGVIDVAPGESADIRNTTLQGVTLEGAAIQQNGIDNFFTDGLINNGTWTLASAGADTFTQFTGSQSITGSGQIVLSDSPSNRIISNGATITVGAQQTLRGAGQLGANSAAFVNQGTLLAEGTDHPLQIDPNANRFENRGLVHASGAAGLVVTDGYFQTAGETRVDSVLSGNLDLQGGLLTGGGTVTGAVLNSGGTVNAGSSPGTLAIDGQYTQTAGGTLLVEIAGTDPGLFDVLLIDGSASLGGTLAVDLIGSPVITAGQIFDVLIADTITGLFANAQAADGAALFDISIIDGVQDIVRLTAVTTVPLPASAWMLLAGFAGLLRWRRARPA